LLKYPHVNDGFTPHLAIQFSHNLAKPNNQYNQIVTRGAIFSGGKKLETALKITLQIDAAV